MRTLAQRTFNARTFTQRTLAGVDVQLPSQSGWITKTADRLSVTRPQDRVWIARKDNG